MLEQEKQKIDEIIAKIPEIYRYEELLSVTEMKEAEQKTIEAGTSVQELMNNAGIAVADFISKDYSDHKKIVVLAGLGSNGGDGYVAAHLLMQRGFEVNVYSVGDHNSMSGAAKEACEAWLSETNSSGIKPAETLDETTLHETDLVIDAIIGIGLSGPLSDTLVNLVNLVNDNFTDVVSIDIPTGVDGNTGAMLPVAINANATVTFLRSKIGHILFPGRDCTGYLHLVPDIGIIDNLYEDLKNVAVRASIGINILHYESYKWYQHKYDRGHVLVISGGRYTSGASRLAAQAAAKSGAGMVTIAGRTNALDIHANHVTSIMLKPYNRLQELQKMIVDEMKIDTIVIGPGLGENAKQITQAIIELQYPTVIDADSLTAFEKNPNELLDILHDEMIVTPHAGEFKRLFPDADIESDKLQAVRRASEKTEAVILLKGPDTIVTSASLSETMIFDNAPHWLATAGSGDVLAGIIASQSAQGNTMYNAATFGTYVHGEAGQFCGGGSTASDLVVAAGKVFQSLTGSNSNDPSG